MSHVRGAPHHAWPHVPEDHAVLDPLLAGPSSPAGPTPSSTTRDDQLLTGLHLAGAQSVRLLQHEHRAVHGHLGQVLHGHVAQRLELRAEFLLDAGERSHWHRVDAAELWLWHAGAPLRLGIGADDVTLGPDVVAGHMPQAMVPPGEWQAAWAGDGWTLVSCIVAPGFDFAGFELAPPDWSPRT